MNCAILLVVLILALNQIDSSKNPTLFDQAEFLESPANHHQKDYSKQLHRIKYPAILPMVENTQGIYSCPKFKMGPSTSSVCSFSSCGFHSILINMVNCSGFIIFTLSSATGQLSTNSDFCGRHGNLFLIYYPVTQTCTSYTLTQLCTTNCFGTASVSFSDYGVPDIRNNSISMTTSYALCNFISSTNIHLRLSEWICQNSYPVTNPCLWRGIQCSSTYEIIRIDLSNKKLSGFIPSSIGLLQNLEVFDISINLLNGTLPQSIGSLTSLKYLAFYSNSFKGSIPSTFCQLSKLEYLSGYTNVLSKPIPTCIGLLTNLHYFRFSINKLSSSLPSAIGVLSGLTHINLRSNRLISSIPSTLLQLSQLEILALYGNSLTNSIPTGIGYLTNLQQLSLNSNRLQYTIPSSVGYLHQLTNLYLHANSLTSFIPSSIGDLTNMIWLSLHTNRLSSSIPSTVGSLSFMNTLDLHNNGLSSTIPLSITRLTALTILDLSANKLSGPIPADIGLLTSLRTIALNNNNLFSTIPSSLSEIKPLSQLLLQANRLTSSMPSSLSALSNLLTLNVNLNLLEGSIPESFSVLLRIQNLILSNNKFTGVPPSSICTLKSLQYLYLANNHLDCVLSCQRDGNWSSNSLLHRCADLQDVALYDLASSLNIASALQDLVFTISRSYESTHPMILFQPVFVSVIDAFQYTVTFDQQSVLCLTAYYQLCNDLSCSKVFGTYSGSGNPTFTINKSSFYLACSGCSSCFGPWGYKLYVTVWTHPPSSWSFTASSPTLTTSPLVDEINWKDRVLGSGSRHAVNSTVVLMDTQTQTEVATSVYANGLCQRAWTGIGCSQGVVTSLSISGFGLRGSLPSSIGYLKGLTSLDLSSNAIEGTLPSSLGLLTALRIFTVSTNNFGGTVPATFSMLSSLILASFSYNVLSGSLPVFFNASPSLGFLYLDGNRFYGEVSSAFCRTVTRTNVTLTIKGNRRLTCYQEVCWSRSSPQSRHFDEDLIECAPTQSPTYTPSEVPSPAPTFKPTAGAPGSMSIIEKYEAVIIACSICGGLFVSSLIYLIFHYHFKKSSVIQRHRKERLKLLPIHAFLLSGKYPDGVKNEEDTKTFFDLHLETAKELDYDLKTALDIILEKRHRVKITSSLVYMMLMDSLPPGIEPDRKLSSMSFYFRPRPPAGNRDSTSISKTSHAWTSAVQSDDDVVVEAVNMVLENCRGQSRNLAQLTDKSGRRSVDIASPRCKALILRRNYLHERYEIKEGSFEHISATSLVLFAIDHGEDVFDKGLPVAMKFMRHQDQFRKEVDFRALWNFEMRYVIPILSNYDSERDSEDDRLFREDAKLRGFQEYPYCVVMEAASYSLKRVIDQQHIAGKAWEEIKSITKQLSVCLQHLHSKGMIHGDLKPLNVVITPVHLKLIDFDSSSSFLNQEYTGSKFSTCYLPPELLFLGDDNSVNVRKLDKRPERPVTERFGIVPLGSMHAFKMNDFKGILEEEEEEEEQNNSLYGHDDEQDTATENEMEQKTDKNLIITPTNLPKQPYECVLSDPSQDIWSLGCILYLLCTGSTLFQGTVDDNITTDDGLRLLYNWDEHIKNNLLEKVTDKFARNLLSMLLNKEPKKRPSINHVLSHPFLTGRQPTRLQGDKAIWDVFLSYRVASDLKHADALFTALQRKGISVWWDKKCLPPGQPWEEGFCHGLINSKSIVLLMSREGLANLTGLDSDSRCDNMLLEWRLALELKEMGLLEGIYPVMIGDRLPDGTYGNFFQDGCCPQAPNVIVNAIEEKLTDHLDREGLGHPYLGNLSLSTTIKSILENQGGFLEGGFLVAIDSLATSVRIMLTRTARNNSSKEEKENGLGDRNLKSTVSKVKFSLIREKMDVIGALENRIRELEQTNEQLKEVLNAQTLESFSSGSL